jgi:hypothetical protein
MTYSRPRRTTIGPGCLTAVFGMGTGGTIQVCSPRKARESTPHQQLLSNIRTCWRGVLVPIVWQREKLQSSLPWPEGAEKRINAAKRSAVSTGQLSVLPHVHLRPIDLVVFQEPSSLRTGDLVWQGVSRLDAFSVYPGRTWLPSVAASATTGTPEVRPSQSSRTREKAAQVSYAHNR